MKRRDDSADARADAAMLQSLVDKASSLATVLRRQSAAARSAEVGSRVREAADAAERLATTAQAAQSDAQP
ncbi:MAG: hypothetical protein AAF561_16820 [Planctomycetota bacterium]